MKLEPVRRLAREGRLYPSIIVHGGAEAQRREVTVEMARTLLCESEDRPCGTCRHCRRIAWSDDDDVFHPDFHRLERDLRTTTSADATKRFLSDAYEAPFEARGQVYAVAEADSLSDEAADALLKLLEEPPLRSPRHFFLLTPSLHDLLPTLRSRSLAVYLGPAEALDPETVENVAAEFHEAVKAWAETRSALHILTAAEALVAVGGWDDARARRPWATAAAAVVRAREGLPPRVRRQLLELAESLLDGVRWRLRAVRPERILEGLVSRALTGSGA